MECHDGKKIAPRHVYFGSGAKEPFHKLSNFYACRVVFDGVEYPSSEHAFQAQRVAAHRRRELFSTDGAYADLVKGFRNFFPRDSSKAEKKASYWGKKKNVGVIAKMLVARTNNLVEMSESTCADIFFNVLKAKYIQNEDAKRVLLSTGDRYLVEFDRGAERKRKSGKVCRWGALVREGRVVGSNQMGALLMRVRDQLARLDDGKHT